MKEETISLFVTNVEEAEDDLKKLGVAIKDSFGNLRDADDILTDLGKPWKGLPREHQKSLGIAIAGRYQLSRFLIIMERFT